MLRSWDELFPNGRMVFYEGDDPEGFATAMATRYNLDVKAPIPDYDSVLDTSETGWDADCDGRPMRAFFIPPGLMQEIYGSDEWPLGS